MGDRFESHVDRLVREAIERGEFDDLPGAGKPIAGLDARHDPDWWIKQRMERENLRPALPTPLALRREREEIQNTLASVVNEDDARAIIDDLNRRIGVANAERNTRVPIFVRALPMDETLAEWRAQRRLR